MKDYLLFFTSYPKSYRLAKQCRGSRCLSVFQFHIWRWYQLRVRDHLGPSEKENIGIKQGTLYGYDLILKAPLEAISDVINKYTLGNYIQARCEKGRFHPRDWPPFNVQ